VPVGFGSTAFEVSVRAPYWGSRAELIEVLELARRGQVHVEVETFSLDEAPRAYELLHDGRIRGRAVVVPG
jgi:propanol-preferring alcohol dehydrogenase